MLRLSVIAFCVVGLVGCSGGETPTPTAKSEASAAKTTHPAGVAAQRFLTAVIDGDSTVASSYLTPLSVAEFRSQGKTFSPPGLANATFKIGRVEQPSPTGALVQCDVQAKDSAGNLLDEEMCCLLQLVESKWLVCGIAYGSNPEDILDFENMTPQKPQVAPTQMVEKSAGSVPPQTAQAPGGTQVR